MFELVLNENKNTFQRIFKTNRPFFNEFEILKSIYKYGFFNKLSAYYKAIFENRESQKDILECWNHFFTDIYTLVHFTVDKDGDKQSNFYLKTFNLPKNLYNLKKIGQKLQNFPVLGIDNKNSYKNNNKSSVAVKKRMLEWNLEMLSMDMLEKSVLVYYFINDKK